jgi:hypothetical protein
MVNEVEYIYILGETVRTSISQREFRGKKRGKIY